MKKKIYIAGAAGMLGDAFYSVFKDEYDLKCTDINCNEDWVDFLDFREFESYKNDVYKFAPDYLFHLGAHTDLEYCEKNIEDAYLTNSISVENAVIIANMLDIPILYISTAGIFDGAKDFYDDWDTPNPLCVYARTKFIGEQYIINNAKKYLICRAGWMMGGGFKKDKKFVKKIILQIANGQTELNVVIDKNGTPTYTYDFAHNTKELLKSEYWGLYNMVSGGLTSRYDIAMEIVAILGLQDSIKINAVNSNFFQYEYFAKRPDSERLINSKLTLRNLNNMRDWKITLNEYLVNHYSEYFSHKKNS